MSAGRHVRRVTGLRALRRPIILFACAFAFASGTAAFAYTTVSGTGVGQAQAVALHAPGAGTVSAPTATSLTLSWPGSPDLPHNGGYLVLRSTSATGPFEKASSGTCHQNTTLISAATSCTDTGLTAGTTYYYEVESAYYDVSTLWVSAPDAVFSGATSPAASGPASPAPAPAPKPGGSGTPPPSAPAFTSASATTFLVGTPGTFQVTAKGNPAPTFSNAAFSGCTPSTLPGDITATSKGVLAGSPVAADVGSYTLCLTASNGVAPAATQKLTLTVVDQTLVFSSHAASGAASSAPNLGPVTVHRQTGAGAAITTGALTVSLSSNPATGATFGLAQFASARVTSVTIPAGQSSATFWYGAATAGSPAITASAVGAVSGTQVETVTAAPVGLGLTLAAGGTGSPVLTCGPVAASATCNVSGVGPAGSVVLTVGFRNGDGSPAVYSATQSSAVAGSGGTGGATIAAGAASSGPITVPMGASSLSFGPYTLVLNVGA